MAFTMLSQIKSETLSEILTVQKCLFFCFLSQTYISFFNTHTHTHTHTHIKGWSGGAMVLGKLLVPGRPTI